MSDRPTPETDAAWVCFKGYMEPLQDVKDLSQKLERERDEAREAFVIATDQMVQAQCKTREALRERDEARAERDILRLDAQREAEHHDRMVKEIEGLYDQLAKTKPSNEHICSLSKDMMGNCIICDG